MSRFTMDEGVLFGICTGGVFLCLFVVELLRVRMNKESLKREQYASASTWGIFLILVCAGHVHQPNDPSIMITCGATMQLLAFILLWVAPRRHEVSSRAPRAPTSFAALFALLLALRLCVTMRWNGYLPVDPTGDGCIQIMEAGALVLSLYGLTKASRPSKSEVRQVVGVVIACMVAGFVCFGDLDRNTGADETYAFCMYLETAAWFFMLKFVQGPQSDGVNSVFLLPSAVQAFCRSYFWFAAHAEVEVKKPVRLQMYFNSVLFLCHVVIGMVCSWMSTQKIKDLSPSLPISV